MPKLRTVRDRCFFSFLISQVQLVNKSRLFELGPLPSGPLATDLAPSCPPISLFRQTWWHHCSADRALRFRLSSGQRPRQVVSLWVTDWPPLTRLTSCPPTNPADFLTSSSLCMDYPFALHLMENSNPTKVRCE